MPNALLFVLFIIPMATISYYHNWPIGIFGTLAYILLLFSLPDYLKKGWKLLLYSFLAALPFFYSLFLVLGGLITGSLLLVLSLVLARRIYKSYQNTYLRIHVRELWEAFTIYLPEEEPVYTFEGTIPLDSVQTLEIVKMPAKKFMVTLNYTAHGVDYEQEHEFLWVSFVGDIEDNLEDYGDIAGQPMQFYYNPENPLEVMRPPSSNYPASYIDTLLKKQKSKLVIPVLSSLLGVILIIIGLTS